MIDYTDASQAATVAAKGDAMSASVELNGSLMEMLATVYTLPLLAAVREAIQNGCDAARRAGRSFKECVMVTLPTSGNPTLTVTDQGDGMSDEFVRTTYMAFGLSTKKGDSGSAGGLGVGRWAAYGYAGEACLATTAKGEMVTRTYFQFKGADGIPKVQLASEAPGVVHGTSVFFPVKATDLRETYQLVAWLQGVMELTLGDSFSVDKPDLLPADLLPFSGHVFELGEEDPSLQGIRVYPMQTATLQLSRTGLTAGSLVVLTNRAAGVGGLPFHVKSSDRHSVFSNGMVVEIPMSFKVPFMPSREEVKYTDEFVALQRRIDEAFVTAALKKVGALFRDSSLVAKRQLCALLGTKDYWHSLCLAARGTGPYYERLNLLTGGVQWTGALNLPCTASMSSSSSLEIKRFNTETSVVNAVHLGTSGENLSVMGKEGNLISLRFNASKAPPKLVYNDLEKGGLARFRLWASGFSSKETLLLYFSSEKAGEAKLAAEELRAHFGGEFDLIATSSLPDVPRLVVGSKVVSSTARGSTIQFFDASSRVQSSCVMDFTDSTESAEPKVWITKVGASLIGFKPDCTLRSLEDYCYGHPSLSHILRAFGLSRLYLLTEKQTERLAAAKAAAVSAGMWDAEPEESEDKEKLAALKGWISLEDFMAQALTSEETQKVLNGERFFNGEVSYELNRLFKVLAQSPAMALKGTKFDAALAPYVDVLTGTLKQEGPASQPQQWVWRCRGLVGLGEQLVPAADDSPERKKLFDDLQNLKTAGTRDFREVWGALTKQFPLLEHFHSSANESSLGHFYMAIAALYR